MLSWIIIAIIMSVITLTFAIQKRDAPKSRYFIILTLSITTYNVGRAFESAATTAEAAYFGVILAYIGLPYIPLLMLFFLFDYYEININKRPLALLWIPLVLTSVFVTFPSLRHLYYADYHFVPGPPIGQIVVQGTIFYYAMFAYHQLLNLISLALSLWGAIKFSKTARWSSLSVFTAVLLPMLGEVLYVLRLTPMQMEIAPIALFFSVAFLGLAVHRLNLLRVLPLAKDAIWEQMSDAFIIVDLDSRYLEANVAAKKQFAALADVHVGEVLHIDELFPGATEGLDGRTLVSVTTGDVQHYYHLSETAIEKNRKKRCICYTLHNVTDTRKLMAELKTMATYDALTGIYNRASFYRLATDEIERAKKQRTSVCVFGFDIDRFKDINDTYGHYCGDLIIKGVVNRIAARLRGGDIFGRVGGDEFNVLLPNTTVENATRLAEALQKIVSAEPFPYEEQQIPATVSIGVAAYDEHRHADFEQLLLDVDSAMYESKKSGRNTVSVHATEGEQG